MNTPANPTPTHDPTDQSIGGLIKQLAHEVPSLLRKEVALAKSEMRENLRESQVAVGEIATGGAIVQAGLIVLLMAFVYGLHEIVGFDLWVSALLIGAIAALVGVGMLSSGKKKLNSHSLRPERTVASLHKDKDVISGGAA